MVDRVKAGVQWLWPLWCLPVAPSGREARWILRADAGWEGTPCWILRTGRRPWAVGGPRNVGSVMRRDKLSVVWRVLGRCMWSVWNSPSRRREGVACSRGTLGRRSSEAFAAACPTVRIGRQRTVRIGRQRTVSRNGWKWGSSTSWSGVLNGTRYTTARLGDVAAVNMGQSPPSSTVNEAGHGLPFVQGNAEFGSRHPQPVKFCTEPKRRAQAGDILLSVRAPVGALNLTDKALCIGRGLSAITATRVDASFLWHALRREASHLARVSQGSTFAAVNKDDLHGLEIPLPSLPEQRKIAAILSSVDDAIEKTQSVINQVQVVKRGLMQELFTRGLPGRHTRFKQTKVDEIPEEWHLVRIGQVGVVEAGRQRSPKAQGRQRPYLRVANVYDGYIDTTSLLSMPFSEPEYNRLKLVPGDLLLNEGQSKELVGRCAQYSGEPRDCCFQNTLVRFRAGDRIGARFAFWVFRHYFYSGVFSAIARQTTSVAHLGVSRFANLKLALPDLEEQSAIVESLETLNKREEAEQRWLTQLSVVKSALMSVLLTGELRIIPDGGIAGS